MQRSDTENIYLFLGCSRLWRYMKLTRRRLMSFDLGEKNKTEIITKWSRFIIWPKSQIWITDVLSLWSLKRSDISVFIRLQDQWTMHDKYKLFSYSWAEISVTYWTDNNRTQFLVQVEQESLLVINVIYLFNVIHCSYLISTGITNYLIQSV